MTATIDRHALVFAALALVLVIATTGSAAHASTIGSADMNDVFKDAGAGTLSFFNWKAILGFVVYVVLPIVAILGCVMCVNNIKDNPQPGNVIGNAIAIAFMLGICLVCVAIPSKINAQQTSANGALLPATSIVAPR
jgi:glucan phosphoethanolaminetransferase (alkaline phosphatase superfamily)